jgi:hypothetical protein
MAQLAAAGLLTLGLAGGLLAAVETLPADVPEAAVTATANQELTINAYLGMVNGEPMFVEGVLRPIDADLRRLARLARNLPDFRIQARDAIEKQLHTQIGDALMMQSAKDALTEADNKRIEAYMNKVTKDLLTKYQGSAAKADQDLRAQGSSIEKELENTKRDLITYLYKQKMFTPKVVVTRRMEMDEYQRNIKEYTVPAEVDLYTITIPISKYLMEKTPGPDGKPVAIDSPTAEQIKAATDQAVAEAKDLTAQIKAGAEFADLARDHSADIKKKLGGRWPHTRQGMLASEEIEKVAFALPAGGVADPLLLSNTDRPTQARVVVVKVGEVTVPHVINFAEAQSGIEKRLRDRQWVELNEDYFRKLQEHAAIEGVDKMVDTVTDAAVTRYLVR